MSIVGLAMTPETKGRSQRLIASAVACLIWLLLWQVLSHRGVFGFMLASPAATALRLVALLSDNRSRLAIVWTSGNVAMGLVAGLMTSILVANVTARPAKTVWGACLTRTVESPLLVLRSVPLAPLIVFLVFVLPDRFLSPVVAWLVAAPLAYPTLRDERRRHRPLRDAATVYHVPFLTRFWLIDVGECIASVTTLAETAVGMCLRAAVVAELIAFVKGSLGVWLYDAKATLDSALLFATTIIIVALAMVMTALIRGLGAIARGLTLRSRTPRGRRLSKRLLVLLTTLFGRQTTHSTARRSVPVQGDADASLVFDDVSFSYGDRAVIKHLSFALRRGQCRVLNSPSGSGKTTTAHLAAHLLTPLSGMVRQTGRLALVFQTPRLIGAMSARDNVLVFRGGLINASARADAERWLLAFGLPLDQIDDPVSTFSLGMMRRVALALACATHPDVLILDEPFASLDAANRDKAYGLIPWDQAAVLLIDHNVDDGGSCDEAEVG